MDNSPFLPYVRPDQRRRAKDRLNRLMRYIKWLNETHRWWFDPDLRAYLIYLAEQGLQPASVETMLAAVRARYSDLLKDQDSLNKMLAAYSGAIQAEFVEKMWKAADPRETKFDYKAKLRSYNLLRVHQATQLLNAPDLRMLSGLRNLAIISTMMFMGLRESEVRLLIVEDLLFEGGVGETGIHVPAGPASTERFVPFYQEFPVQVILETWLSKAGIKEGPVFRGFFRNEYKIREKPITIQAIEDIFRMYPINEGEEVIQIKPVDLRIFYARMLFALDFSLDVISSNLGVQTQTAVNYIGTPSTEIDKIPAFPIDVLNTISFPAQNGSEEKASPK